MFTFRVALPVAAAALSLLVAPTKTAGQNLSIGILAGGSLTDGFTTETFVGGTRFLSTSKDYLIGPTIQWRLSPSWSIEAEGLFRELHGGRAQVQSNGTAGSVSPAAVVTWEFPLLAKYRFTNWRTRPFMEAGPSLRTAGNLNGTNPSHYGFTAGAGIEVHAKALTFAPVIRYTRWAGDGTAYQAGSNSNQLEVALGVSASPESNIHPLTSRIFIGGVIGVGLTEDIHVTAFSFVSGVQSYSSMTSPRRGVLLGPVIEAALPAACSLEADAIYAPLRSITASSFNGLGRHSSTTSIGNWELPILAKRHIRTRFVSPFIEAGPAFRVGTGQLSHYGVTAGLGLETRVRKIRIAPTLRYSHWAVTEYGAYPVIRNQLELFAAFTY